MRRFLITAISVILAMLAAFMTPLNCIAADSADYIKDIKIGYGDSGKQALKDAGYTIWSADGIEFDANEGGNGDSVWIGYLATKDADDAIRDIATMNMDGGYSFEDYTKELKEISESITAMVTEFKKAISEYRSNYESENYFAMRALEALNVFYDDDTGKNIGDLFLDKNTTDEQLHTVFMQGNTESLNTIEQILCLGLTEVKPEDNTGYKTFIERLPEAVKKTENLDPSLNTARESVLEAVKKFRFTLSAAEETYNKASKYKDFKEYAGTLAQEVVEEETQKYILYQLAKETKFGNTNMTLLEACTLSQTTADSQGRMFDVYMADILARTMTEGQRAIVGSVGLDGILLNNYGYITGNKGDGLVPAEMEEAIDFQFELLEDVGEISIYAGVDRSLFSNKNEDIALTSAAIRQNVMSEGTNLGRDTSKSWKENKALRTSMIVMAVVGAASTVVATSCLASAKYSMKVEYTYYADYIVESTGGYQQRLRLKERDKLIEAIRRRTNDGDQVRYGSYKKNVCCFGDYTKKLMGCLCAFEIVSVVVTAVFTVMALITNLYKPEEKDIEYSKIPRVLVDLRPDKDGNKYYFAYYATGLITPKTGSANTLELYGDLNGYNKKNPWTALYYSKDERLGEPLTTDMLIKKGEYTLSYDEANQYQGIHSFSSTGAADFNEKNTKNGAPKIYAFLKKTSVNTKTYSIASLFNLENYLITGISVTVGAAITFAITYTVMKKRKQQTE